MDSKTKTVSTYMVTVPNPIGSGETKDYELMTSLDTAINWAENFIKDVYKDGRLFGMKEIKTIEDIPAELVIKVENQDGSFTYDCSGDLVYPEKKECYFQVKVWSRSFEVETE